MVRLFHATTERALPQILKNGLCPPYVHGDFTGTINWELAHIKTGPDPRRALYFVRDPLDAENLAYTFSGGGIPTLLVINDRDFVGVNGCRRVERGNETILVNPPCIPLDHIRVWQYVNGKWKKLK